MGGDQYRAIQSIRIHGDQLLFRIGRDIAGKQDGVAVMTDPDHQGIVVGAPPWPLGIRIHKIRRWIENVKCDTVEGKGPGKFVKIRMKDVSFLD